VVSRAKLVPAAACGKLLAKQHFIPASKSAEEVPKCPIQTIKSQVLTKG